MPDPNARLIAELKDLTRALEANTKELKEANRLKKREGRATSFVNYQGEEIPDADSSEGSDDRGTGPYQSGTSTPYS
jgi:hypothetical protein